MSISLGAVGLELVNRANGRTGSCLVAYLSGYRGASTLIELRKARGAVDCCSVALAC